MIYKPFTLKTVRRRDFKIGKIERRKKHDAERWSRTAGMTDTLTPAARSERMGRIKGKDNKPEMSVRSWRFLRLVGKCW